MTYPTKREKETYRLREICDRSQGCHRKLTNGDRNSRINPKIQGGLVHPVSKVLLIIWDIPVNGKLVEGEVLVVFRNPGGVDMGNSEILPGHPGPPAEKVIWTQKIYQSNAKPQEVFGCLGQEFVFLMKPQGLSSKIRHPSQIHRSIQKFNSCRKIHGFSHATTATVSWSIK